MSKLASFDRRSEDVLVLAIVIAELELGNIERHIFAAHFVERADHAALEDRPEAFDSLSVNCADDILASGVINGRVWIILIERIVAGILIGAKQADFVGDGFANKGGESGGIYIRNHARDHIPLAADGADDWRFARTNAAGSAAAAAAFIPMPVLGQAADESFIDLDDSAKLVNVLHQRGSDLMTHEPSGFIGTKTHVAMYLPRANALLASQHEVNNTEPIAKRFIRVFEDSSGNMRKAVVFRCASIALPMPRHCRDLVIDHGTAPRAADTIRPALADEISTTSGFIGKHRFELGDGQLMDLWGLFCSSHDDLSFVGETIA